MNNPSLELAGMLSNPDDALFALIDQGNDAQETSSP